MFALHCANVHVNAFSSSADASAGSPHSSQSPATWWIPSFPISEAIIATRHKYQRRLMAQKQVIQSIKDTLEIKNRHICMARFDTSFSVSEGMRSDCSPACSRRGGHACVEGRAKHHWLNLSIISCVSLRKRHMHRGQARALYGLALPIRSRMCKLRLIHICFTCAVYLGSGW